MRFQRRHGLALILGAVFLAACSNYQPPSVSNPIPNQNTLFVSDLHDILVLDPDQGQVSYIENRITLECLQFDKNQKQLVATAYSPESRFDGFVYFDVSGKGREDVNFVKRFDKPFAPVYWYQYENIYLMNSAIALGDGVGSVTELGFFDTKERKMIKTFQVPGIVQDITGNGPKAYVTSYNNPEEAQKRSNIYEVDLITKEFRKVFAEDQDYVPLEIGYQHGFLYGVYQYVKDLIPKDGPQNLFVKIDPKTGEIVQKLQLSENARDLAFSSDGKYAFVTHYAQDQSKLAHPLTRIDLDTFKATDIPGDYRPISMLEHNGKLYIGDSFSKCLLVVNEQSLQVEKTIPLPIFPIYLVNENGRSKHLPYGFI